ncbi:MAG: IS66 family transposase [Azonexus sp.]|jgi:transposase|nr:IS66 family transposase [Azonexus sp.]
MPLLPDLLLLDHASKDALLREQGAVIARQAEQIAQLIERVAELEGRLSQPPKTPGNSSLPPSTGRKPSQSAVGKDETRRRKKGRSGSFRELCANPSRTVDLRIDCCPHCRSDLSQAPQRLCEAYDHIDIPPVVPVVTRIHLHGGDCPGCGKQFKAAPPAGMASGSPFGENLRALVSYLRHTQGIGFERLRRLLDDLFGLAISEGALINMTKAAADPFAAQVEHIRERLLGHDVIASDETGMRVGKRNFWFWVFHHHDSAVFRADPSRAKRVPEAFLAGHRPQFWLSDRYGAQKGFAAKGHQFCLAHLIRDAQYAVDAGDSCFAPGLIALFKRACRIGRKRQQLSDRELRFYHRKYVKKLSELLRLKPSHAEGCALQKTIAKIRANLFLFLLSRALDATNNGSERALRPCVTFRKITNGFRTSWRARFYADVRSVIETARRRAIPILQAIRMTLNAQHLQIS